jgi:hypothetical protein
LKSAAQITFETRLCIAVSNTECDTVKNQNMSQ